MFKSVSFMKRALVIALCLGLLVVALGALTAAAAPAPVAISGTIDVPGNFRGGLRYTGNPPPSFSSDYLKGSPEIICQPEVVPASFTGTLDVGAMNKGDVALIGLLDKDLMASGAKGYQSGAYLYVYKNTDTALRIGPSDGNAGGEMVQTFFALNVPPDNMLDIDIAIDGTVNPVTICGGSANDDGCITITVEGQTRVDSYGVVGTTGVEFANGAYPGWDDYYNSGVDYNLTLNGCEATPLPQVSLQAADDLICNGATTMTIDFSQVPYLYGYEFMVEYDDALVNVFPAFVDDWFDTSLVDVIKPWDATCANGVCSFAASRQNPLGPIEMGNGPVAKIDFTPKAAGSFTAEIKNVVLSNIDGFAIETDLVMPSIDFDICGKATVRGYVSLQGRVTPGNGGWIKLIDEGNQFPPIDATFDSSGYYNVSDIPVMAGGSTYTLQATHYLYLGNKRSVTLYPNPTATVLSTRLLGGDADNSGLFGYPDEDPVVLPGIIGVDSSDIGCIGAQFGTNGSGVCGTHLGNATDINNDGKTNIQDLSMTAGNYFKNPFQPW